MLASERTLGMKVAGVEIQRLDDGTVGFSIDVVPHKYPEHTNEVFAEMKEEPQ